MVLGGQLPGRLGPCQFTEEKGDPVSPFSFKRLHGQAVKTPPFHGGNPGSIPGGVTKEKIALLRGLLLYLILILHARVAELADALDLGSSGNPVQVQVLSCAPLTVPKGRKKALKC